MYHTSLLKLIESEPLARFALAIPAAGTLLGSVFMVFGGFLPCLIMDALGLVIGLLVLIGLVFKYLWIEHLLIEGEERRGKVTRVRENPGLPISQTTDIDYQYSFAGVKYSSRITVHLSEDVNLQTPTIIFDPDNPDNSIIKELYCVLSC
jgi:hypothetical protein